MFFSRKKQSIFDQWLVQIIFARFFPLFFMPCDKKNDPFSSSKRNMEHFDPLLANKKKSYIPMSLIMDRLICRYFC